MSVEQDLWTAFKNQLQANITLAAYVTTWKFNRTEQALDPTNLPLLAVYPDGVDEEKYLAIPKIKVIYFRIAVHGKIYNTTGTTLEGELLKFDELIKNAMETNLQMSGACTMINVGNTKFNVLDNNVGELTIDIVVTSSKFTTGLR